MPAPSSLPASILALGAGPRLGVAALLAALLWLAVLWAVAPVG
jgi:hypothetical protein